MKIKRGGNKLNCFHSEYLLKESEEKDKNINDFSEIEKIKKRLKEIPEIRWDKVAKIKKAIDNNEYHVDPHLIAGKIINQLEQE